MINLAQNIIEINRPIEEVYSFVTNMENYGKWFPEVVEIKSKNNLEHGVIGKKYIEFVKDPFKGKVQIVIEVKEAVKNTRFITEGEYTPLLPQMVVNFSEIKNGYTLVNWKLNSRNKNFIIRLFLFPAIKFILRKRADAGLKNLKGLLDMPIL